MSKTDDTMFDETIEHDYDECPRGVFEIDHLREKTSRLTARVASLESAIRGELQTLDTSSACTARTAARRLRAALDGKPGGAS